VLGSFQRRKAEQEETDLLTDLDYKRSTYKSIVEEVYQQYLSTSLKSIERYKLEREKLLAQGQHEEAQKKLGNIKFETSFIRHLKESKADYDRDTDKAFSDLLTLDSSEEVRKEVSDCFSANASVALGESVR